MQRSTNIYDSCDDRVIASPIETVDITIVQGLDETPKVKNTQARMDFTNLTAQFPLLKISKNVFGEGTELSNNEDVNTQDLMSSASEKKKYEKLGVEDEDDDAIDDEDYDTGSRESPYGEGDTESSDEE
ncbi:hypothetical protein HAX54_016064 [Datura stramonium]|uniref:Uncharacterized protein n=1 Tax=Datura stramonium TaxID=4076 RepID=A0ABS8Y2Y8_DATST|nr:hypothetical protein [Datura stramonium]